jgi:hypothetical protein
MCDDSDNGVEYDYPGPVIMDGWLIGRISVQEAEVAETFKGIPFGYINDLWEAMKSRMLPDDELWRFDSGLESWRELRGWRGYAVRRHGKVVDSIWTSMS